MKTDSSKADLKNNMRLVENIIYWIFCVLSLGSIWLIKIIIRKAIDDSKLNKS